MRNAHAITSKAPKEWGRQDRQDEAALRGFRRRGREDAIAEALSEMEEIEREEREARSEWNRRQYAAIARDYRRNRGLPDEPDDELDPENEAAGLMHVMLNGAYVESPYDTSWYDDGLDYWREMNEDY